MVKKGLCLLVAGALPAAAMADGLTVYGKGNLTYQMESYEERVIEERDEPDSDVVQADGDTWKMESNASRFGIKGSNEVKENLEVVYQLEWEVDISDKDDGDGDNILKARNSFAGLKGNWGKVIAGTHDTPLKLAAKKIDLFNDLEGDIKGVLKAENRLQNIVFYSSPKLADAVTLNLAFVPGEDTEFVNGEDEENGIADAFSASAVFKQGGIYAAVAYDSEVKELDTIRVIAKYKADNFSVGAMWQDSESSEGDSDEEGYIDEDGMSVGASYTLDKNTLKVQHTASDMSTEGAEFTSLGLDHKLAKKTKVFAFYTDKSYDDSDLDETIFAVGLEHKFSL